MKNRKRDTYRRSIVLAAAFLCCLLSVFLPGQTLQRVQAEEETHLVITVVEDPVSVELEDEEVPLAAFPGNALNVADRSGAEGNRHIFLMALALACVIVYVMLRVHSERKLLALREETARAEQQMMRRQREQDDAGKRNRI